MSEKRNLLGLPKPPLYSLFLSTGCINRCRFCMTDRQYRVRSVNNLFRDIRAILKKHRTLLPPRFMLVDDCAFGNPESLEKLLHGLTLLRKTRVFEIMMQFHLSPIIRDPGILDRMVKAGVKTLLLGMESVSEAALRDQAKNITPDKCSRVIELCRSKGVVPYGYFMAGFRTDTPEAIEQTFDYIIRKGLVAQVLPMGIMEPELLDFPEDLGKVLPLKWTDTEMKSLDPASFGAAMKVSHRHPDISPWEMQRLLISGYDRIYSLKRLINIPGLREKIYHLFFCVAYGKWRKQLIKHLEFLKEENSDALCHN